MDGILTSALGSGRMRRTLSALWRWDWPLVLAGALTVRALEAEEQGLLELWDGWEADRS